MKCLATLILPMLGCQALGLQLLESVHPPIHSPESESSHGGQAVDKFTYSYFMLASVQHKLRLVFPHFVHPTNPVFGEITTKPSTSKLSDVMDKTILIRSFTELKFINESINCTGYFAKEIGMVKTKPPSLRCQHFVNHYSLQFPARFAAEFSFVWGSV